MRDDKEHPRAGELANEVANFTVGLGLIVMIAFPFAVPILLLTALLAVPVVLVGLLAGLAAAPFLLIRRLRRSRQQEPKVSGGRATTEPLRTVRPSH